MYIKKTAKKKILAISICCILCVYAGAAVLEGEYLQIGYTDGIATDYGAIGLYSQVHGLETGDLRENTIKTHSPVLIYSFLYLDNDGQADEWGRGVYEVGVEKISTGDNINDTVVGGIENSYDSQNSEKLRDKELLGDDVYDEMSGYSQNAMKEGIFEPKSEILVTDSKFLLCNTKKELVVEQNNNDHWWRCSQTGQWDKINDINIIGPVQGEVREAWGDDYHQSNKIKLETGSGVDITDDGCPSTIKVKESAEGEVEQHSNSCYINNVQEGEDIELKEEITGVTKGYTVTDIPPEDPGFECNLEDVELKENSGTVKAEITTSGGDCAEAARLQIDASGNDCNVEFDASEADYQGFTYRLVENWLEDGNAEIETSVGSVPSVCEGVTVEAEDAALYDGAISGAGERITGTSEPGGSYSFQESEDYIPEPSFSINPSNPSKGDEIQFEAANTESHPDSLTYKWLQTENNHIATGTEINRTFLSAGTFEYTLQLINQNTVKSTSKEFTVRENEGEDGGEDFEIERAVEEVKVQRDTKFSVDTGSELDSENTNWFINKSDRNGGDLEDFSAVIWNEAEEDVELGLEVMGSETISFAAESKGTVNLTAVNDNNQVSRIIEVIEEDGDTCTGNNLNINGLQAYNGGNKVDQLPTDGTGTVEINYSLEEDICKDPYEEVEISLEFAGTSCVLLDRGEQLQRRLKHAEDSAVNASWNENTLSSKNNCEGKVDGRHVHLYDEDNNLIGYSRYEDYSICFEGEACDYEPPDDPEDPGAEVPDAELNNIGVSQNVPNFAYGDESLIADKGVKISADVTNNGENQLTRSISFDIKNGLDGAAYKTDVDIGPGKTKRVERKILSSALKDDIKEKDNLKAVAKVSGWTPDNSLPRVEQPISFAEPDQIMISPQYVGWNSPPEFEGSIEIKGDEATGSGVEYSEFPKILEYSEFEGDLIIIDVFDKNGNKETRGYANSNERITYKPDVKSSKESPELKADDWTELPQDVVKPDQNTFEGCESVIVASEEGVTLFDADTGDDIVDKKANDIGGQNSWVKATCQ